MINTRLNTNGQHLKCDKNVLLRPVKRYDPGNDRIITQVTGYQVRLGLDDRILDLSLVSIMSV